MQIMYKEETIATHTQHIYQIKVYLKKKLPAYPYILTFGHACIEYFRLKVG